MDNKLIQEMTSLLKSNVENSFHALNMMQEQSEKITNLMLEQGQNLQNEGKKFMEQWLGCLKEGQAEYQKNLQEQIAQLENFVKKGDA